MRIQHNIMSMNAYRNYNNNTSSLSKNLEKLSSGYKINRAGDDAAGLAISEKMRAQITGLNQAQANAKSGINLVQTAEGAMQEVQDMLNRMVKLADQSANGTFDDETDRANLQKEVVELKKEINRIAESANFNGIKLLDGSMDAAGIIGGGGQPVNISNVSAFTASVANAAPKFSVDLDGLVMKSASNAAGNIKVKVGSQTVQLNFTAKQTGTAIGFNDLTLSTTQKTMTVGGVKYGVTYGTGKLNFTMKTSHVLAAGQTLNPAFAVSIAGSSKANLTAGIINKGTTVITDGKIASAEQQATASLEITKDMLVEGASIKIGDQTFSFDYTKSTTAGQVIGVKDLLNTEKKLGDDAISQVLSRITAAAGTNHFFTVGNDGKNTITLQSKAALAKSDTEKLDTIEEVKELISAAIPEKKGTALTLQIGDTSDSFNRLSVSIQSVKTKDLKIDGVDIGTLTGAQSAVDQIKTAINTVSSIRGTLGATQNRLDHTINNLSVMAENIQDAESTVRDTDVAEEMMAYTKNNILVQSAQAMLAQANQVPQGVLQLLQ